MSRLLTLCLILFGITAPLEADVNHGKIAYSTQGKLYVLDLATHQTTEYANTSGMWEAAWNPDGERIIYGDGVLHILDTATSEATQLISGGKFADWHPDGDRVVYNVPGRGLYLHDVPRDEITKIADNTLQPFQAVWSADGEHLAFVGQVGINKHIFRLDMACLESGDCTDQAQQLTTSGRFNHAPAWSPDGDKIAFERRDPETRNFAIVVMDLDSGEQTRISPPDVSDHHPSWTTDGEHIVFARETDQPGLTSNVYIMRADGSEVRQLTQNGGMSPDYWG